MNNPNDENFTNSESTGTPSVAELSDLMRNLLTCLADNTQAPVLTGNPPTFSGDDNENFEAYLRRFDRYGQANGWDSEKSRLVLPWALQGTAAEVYDGLSNEQRRTYESLCHALRERFRPARYEEMALDQLMTKMQKKDESVHKFASSIQKLIREGCTDIDPTSAARFRLKFFLRGLRSSIRQRMAPSYTNFEEAVAEAKAQEALLETEDRDSQTNPVLLSILDRLDKFEHGGPYMCPEYSSSHYGADTYLATKLEGLVNKVSAISDELKRGRPISGFNKGYVNPNYDHNLNRNRHFSSPRELSQGQNEGNHYNQNRRIGETHSKGQASPPSLFEFDPRAPIFRPSRMHDRQVRFRDSPQFSKGGQISRTRSNSDREQRTRSNSRERNLYNSNGGKECYNCGKHGHIRTSCPSRGASPGRNSGGCYNCGQIGHIRSFCPFRNTASEQNTVECYNCGRTGHMRSSCPFRSTSPGPNFQSKHLRDTSHVNVVSLNGVQNTGLAVFGKGQNPSAWGEFEILQNELKAKNRELKLLQRRSLAQNRGIYPVYNLPSEWADFQETAEIKQDSTNSSKTDCSNQFDSTHQNGINTEEGDLRGDITNAPKRFNGIQDVDLVSKVIKQNEDNSTLITNSTLNSGKSDPRKIACGVLILFCVIFFFPKGTGASIFAESAAKLTTLVNEPIGVAITPVGLSISTDRSEFLPLIIQIAPPSGEEFPLRGDFSKHQRCENNCPHANFTCTENDYFIEAQVERLRAELKYSYSGILDTAFYQQLTYKICRENSQMCELPHRRKKRFLGLLVGGLLGLTGTGVGIANSVQISKLDSKYNAMAQAWTSVQGRLQKHRKIIHRITEANEHVYAFVHHAITNLEKLISSLECDARHVFREVQKELVVHWFSEKAKHAVENIMAACLHGKITPGIIDIVTLKNVVSLSPSLNNSLLMKELNLAYQFGKVYPLKIDFDNLRFGLLLELPAAFKENVKPIFEIHNVGWNNKGSNLTQKLNLPRYVTREVGKGFSEVNIDQCFSRPGLWFCKPYAVAQTGKSDCINLAIELGTTSKELEEKCKNSMRVTHLKTEPEISTSLAGVLIRTSKSSITVANKVKSKYLISGQTIPVPDSGTMWFSHTNYTHIVIGDTILASTIHPTNEVIQTNFRILDIKIPDLKFRPTEWTDLKAAVSSNLQAEQMIRNEVIRGITLPGIGVSGISASVGISFATALAFGIVTIAYYCNKKRRAYSKWVGKVRFRRNNLDSPELDRSSPQSRNRTSIELPPGHVTDDAAEEIQLLEGQLRRSNRLLAAERAKYRNTPKELLSLGLAPLLITAIIVQRPVTALVDSGAQISVIAKRVVDRLGLVRQIRPACVNTAGVTGHKLQICGQICLNIDLNGRLVNHNVYVSNDWYLNYPCILGSDFQSKLGTVQLDYTNWEMRIGNSNGGEIRIPFHGNVDEKPRKRIISITAFSSYTIPPRHEAVVNGLVECNNPPIYGMRFEPNNKFCYNVNVLIAHSMVNPGDNIVPVSLINPKTHAVNIKEGTVLGYLYYDFEDSARFNLCEIKDTGISNNFRFNHKSRTQVREAILSKKSLPPELSQLTLEKSTLTEPQKGELIELLLRNCDVFAKDDYDLGRCAVFKPKIETGDHKPIQCKPYKLPEKHRELLKQDIQKMLEKNIISPSTSPWSAPILYVPKSDGKFRLCVDFRKINLVSQPDLYPLPRLEDILMSLKGARFFSSIDLSKGFHQLELDERTKHKTSFVTMFGQYEYNVLPMGLKSAPGAFQRCLTTILSGLDYERCLIYLDDILVFSSTFKEHLENLELVIFRIRQANLKLKISKCFFGAQELKYLGHIISPKGISPDPEKVKCIKEFPEPKKVEEVARFLGMAGFYHKFIKDFSKLAAPMNALKRKNVKFNFNEKCREGFEILKECLSKPPILIHPDFNKTFILSTDASAYGLGATLAQETSEGLQPVAFASKGLLSYERNYSTIDREALGIHWAVLHFSPYLYGRKFTIYTDHKPLVHIMENASTKMKLARWRAELAEFVFEIKYRPGKDNAEADCLSRDPRFETVPAENSPARISKFEIVSLNLFEEHNPLQGTTWDDIGEKQRRDPNFGPLIGFLETGDLPDDVKLSKVIVAMADNFTLQGKEKVLYKLTRYRGETTEMLVIPNVLIKEILIMCHESALAGHAGIAKTYARVRSSYYWVGMYNSVKDWVTSCAGCLGRKSPTHPKKAFLHPIPVSKPWDRVHVDILDLHKRTRLGNRYVITYIDAMSKYVVSKAIYDQTAETCAKVFIEEIVCKWGAPRALLSDQGRQFKSALNKEICQLVDTYKIETTSYHPACNGQVERSHKILTDMMAMLVSRDKQDWDTYLPYCIFAYNTAVHSSTGETPFYLLHGFDPRLPSEPSLQLDNSITMDSKNYKNQVSSRIKIAWELASKCIEKAQKKQKLYFDAKANPYSYKVDDIVFAKIPLKSKDSSWKLANPWKGPYRVITVKDPNVEIRLISNPKAPIVKLHMDRIKLGVGPHPVPLVSDSDSENDVELSTVENSQTKTMTNDLLQ